MISITPIRNVFKKNELNLTLLKIWERQIINGHTPYKSDRKGPKVSSGNIRVRAKNTPTQIRTKKNDRKYFRDLKMVDSINSQNLLFIKFEKFIKLNL